MCKLSIANVNLKCPRICPGKFSTQACCHDFHVCGAGVILLSQPSGLSVWNVLKLHYIYSIWSSHSTCMLFSLNSKHVWKDMSLSFEWHYSSGCIISTFHCSLECFTDAHAYGHTDTLAGSIELQEWLVQLKNEKRQMLSLSPVASTFTVCSAAVVCKVILFVTPNFWVVLWFAHVI